MLILARNDLVKEIQNFPELNNGMTAFESLTFFSSKLDEMSTLLAH